MCTSIAVNLNSFQVSIIPSGDSSHDTSNKSSRIQKYVSRLKFILGWKVLRTAYPALMNETAISLWPLILYALCQLYNLH